MGNMGLFDLLKGGKVLYFPGCPAKFLGKDIQRRHEQLLTMMGVDYVKLQDMEKCCGKPALDIGSSDDFSSLRSHNQELFKNQRIRKIITSDPFCCFTFKKKYEDLDVQHISELLLQNSSVFEKKGKNEAITFYDACNPYKLPELYDNPRKILKEQGFIIEELPFCREKSICCGKVLDAVSPKVATAMRKEIFSLCKTSKLITMSPDCYLWLKQENSLRIQVLELSEVLL